MAENRVQNIGVEVPRERFNELIATHILFHKMVFSQLKETELTAGQPKILEFLAERGEATQRQIAQASDIEASTAARILSKMEDANLIYREHREKNRRSIIVSLTQEGNERAELVAEVFRECEKIAFRGIKDEELVLNMLEKIENNLRLTGENSGTKTDSLEWGKRMHLQKTLHYRLLTCHILLRRRLYQGLSDTGLTSGQPKVLEFLKYNEGCQQKEIARACLIEPATVTSILFYMERAGLIERREERGDRRSLYVYLTDSGRQMAERTEIGIRKLVSLAFRGMEEKQEAFGAILRQMYNNLDRGEK